MPEQKRRSHARPAHSVHKPPGGRPPLRRRKKKLALPLAFIGLALAVCVVLGLVFLLPGQNSGPAPVLPGSSLPPSSVPMVSAPQSSSPPQPDPQPVEHRVRFSAVGDNLIHEAVYASAARHAGGNGYDFSYCYENVVPFFEQFDVNWINQETLINDAFPASTYPNFSTPTEMGQNLYDAGWRVFALSNNHSYDLDCWVGTGGVAATVDFWNSMPDDVVTTGLYTGRDDDSGIGLHTVNGITIAYVAFTETTNGIPPHNGLESFVIYTTNLYTDLERAAMEHKVRRARELADVVVVGVHWGVEYSHTPTAGQKSLAAEFANWGADVIIGTHPHVIQPIEYVESADGRQVPVAYSLGNFLSAQNQQPRMVGLAFTFDIALTEEPDGTKHSLQIDNVKAYPTVTHYEYYGGSFYEDSRAYMYQDYTDALAATHAVPGGMSRAYIEQLCRQVVSEEFLVLA